MGVAIWGHIICIELIFLLSAYFSMILVYPLSSTTNAIRPKEVPSQIEVAKSVLTSGVDDNMSALGGAMGKFDPTILERMATAAKELSKSGMTL